MAVVLTEAAGYELIVVDLAIFVHVHTLENVVQLIIGRIDALLVQSFLDLLDRQIPVVVAVHLLEQLPELLDLLRWQLGCDEGQKHGFELSN